MPDEIRFSSTGTPEGLQEWLWEGIRERFIREGYVHQPQPDATTTFVVNFARPDKPNPVLPSLPNSRTKVVTVVQFPEVPDPMVSGYPLLATNVCSLLLMLVGNDSRLETSFLVTLEQGHPQIPFGDPESYFEDVFRRLRPRISATWAFQNHYREDLPEWVWGGTPRTQLISLAGMLLDRLGLLPEPFPLQDYLDYSQRRFVRLAFSLFGLSYGNVSVRAEPEIHEGPAMWMSASGVDKSRLVEVSEHIHLVVGAAQDGVWVRTRPGKIRSRVSVDGLEHYTIYAENPEVGAILHFHGWPTQISDGLSYLETSVEQAYPCGSLELANLTAQQVRAQEDPSAVVIAQANHGTVVTGPDLPSIFLRLQSGQIRYSHDIPQV